MKHKEALVLMTYAANEGSDQTVQMRSVIRVSGFRLYIYTEWLFTINHK